MTDFSNYKVAYVVKPDYNKGMAVREYTKETKKKESKPKKSNIVKRVEKILSERLSSRGVLRKSNATVQIKEFKAPSILGEKSRFFKGELEETKRSMFLE